MAAGFAVAVEYGAVFAGLPVAAMLLWGLRSDKGRRIFGWALGGALVPIALLAAYHWHAFGSPLRTGYHYVINPDFAAKHGQGLLGLSWPTWEATYRNLLSPGGGLLWWAPIVGVAVWGLIDLVRDEQAPHRAVGALNLAVLATLLVVGTGLVFDGGWRVGPRYLVCVLPTMIPGLARIFGTKSERPWVIGLVMVPAGYGAFVNGLAANLWPHLDLTNVHGPVGEVLLPLAEKGFTPYGTLHTLGIPGATWILVGAGVALVAWAAYEVAGSQQRSAGVWGLAGVALGVALVPGLARLIAPHPRAAANLQYIEHTFEPTLEGEAKGSVVLEQLDRLPEPKRRRGHAGRH